LNKETISTGSNQKNKSIIYIAPNGKIYEIFVVSTGVYFTGSNGQKKYFSSLEEAKKIIDYYNPAKKIVVSNNKDQVSDEEILMLF
jgi:hypothetical protein